MRMFPSGCVGGVTMFPAGTTCDVTNEVVPDGMVHVGLVGCTPAAEKVIEGLAREWGWTVEKA